MKEGSMRKPSPKPEDDLLPEYDFAAMKGGVRGKYVARYRSGTNLVLLDPEVARAFPTDAAVNQALLAVLNMTSAVKSFKKPPNQALQRTRQKAARR
jgi:hypothetical protein